MGIFASVISGLIAILLAIYGMTTGWNPIRAQYAAMRHGLIRRGYAAEIATVNNIMDETLNVAD